MEEEKIENVSKYPIQDFSMGKWKMEPAFSPDSIVIPKADWLDIDIAAKSNYLQRTITGDPNNVRTEFKMEDYEPSGVPDDIYEKVLQNIDMIPNLGETQDTMEAYWLKETILRSLEEQGLTEAYYDSDGNEVASTRGVHGHWEVAPWAKEYLAKNKPKNQTDNNSEQSKESSGNSNNAQSQNTKDSIKDDILNKENSSSKNVGFNKLVDERDLRSDEPSTNNTSIPNQDKQMMSGSARNNLDKMTLPLQDISEAQTATQCGSAIDDNEEDEASKTLGVDQTLCSNDNGNPILQEISNRNSNPKINYAMTAKNSKIMVAQYGTLSRHYEALQTFGIKYLAQLNKSREERSLDKKVSLNGEGPSHSVSSSAITDNADQRGNPLSESREVSPSEVEEVQQVSPVTSNKVAEEGEQTTISSAEAQEYIARIWDKNRKQYEYLGSRNPFAKDPPKPEVLMETYAPSRVKNNHEERVNETNTATMKNENIPLKMFLKERCALQNDIENNRQQLPKTTNSLSQENKGSHQTICGKKTSAIKDVHQYTQRDGPYVNVTRSSSTIPFDGHLKTDPLQYSNYGIPQKDHDFPVRDMNWTSESSSKQLKLRKTKPKLAPDKTLHSIDYIGRAVRSRRTYVDDSKRNMNYTNPMAVNRRENKSLHENQFTDNSYGNIKLHDPGIDSKYQPKYTIDYPPDIPYRNSISEMPPDNSRYLGQARSHQTLKNSMEYGPQRLYAPKYTPASMGSYMNQMPSDYYAHKRHQEDYSYNAYQVQKDEAIKYKFIPDDQYLRLNREGSENTNPYRNVGQYIPDIYKYDPTPRHYHLRRDPREGMPDPYVQTYDYRSGPPAHPYIQEPAIYQNEQPYFSQRPNYTSREHFDSSVSHPVNMNPYGPYPPQYDQSYPWYNPQLYPSNPPAFWQTRHSHEYSPQTRGSSPRPTRPPPTGERVDHLQDDIKSMQHPSKRVYSKPNRNNYDEYMRPPPRRVS